MKKLLPVYLVAMLFSSATYAQIQVDQDITFTNPGHSMVQGLDAPTLGTDAANKAYVDAAVAAAGGGNPTMISDESSSSMTLGAAVRYCNSLNSGGYTDWYLPTYEQLLYITSKGGVTVSNNSSADYIWFAKPITWGSNTSYAIWSFRLSDGQTAINGWDAGSNQNYYVRCVR